MGCVQSQVRKPSRKRKLTKEDEEAAAARLLAAQQLAAAQKAAEAEKNRGERRETEVLKRATAFDKLHEEAHRAPSLRDVKVVMGAQSQRLLEGFEAKEAEAHAVPELVSVKKKDLRESKLYDKLKEFEENDARAAREPKLEKSFTQRERERRESAIGTDKEPPMRKSASSSTAIPSM